MGKKIVFGLSGLTLALVTMVGCQSSDSGSNRLMARQNEGLWPKPPATSNASAMSNAKSLGISDTNNRPGMLPASTGVQQAGAVQSGSSPSAGLAPVSTAAGDASTMGAVSGFDQGGQVVSRPMPIPGESKPSSGPVPPPPPGGYTIPPPSAYTPPANPVVPTRKPGDDQ